MFAVSKLVIEGAHRLKGKVLIHGAKNSVLPLLAATILCEGECVLHNCPELSDVDAALTILRYLGCFVQRQGNTLLVDTRSISRSDIPDGLMREMRSSIVFLGAVASRMGKARLSFPGGCELGPRPIDLHLKALCQMGLEIREDHGYLDCFAPGGLKGTFITLSFPSVGATENIILASVCAKGTTVITNAAREPEICDLADFLNACGACVLGAGEGIITVLGQKKLGSAEHTVIPDRIAAATFMTAAAVAGGSLQLCGIVPAHLSPVLPALEEAGCKIRLSGKELLLLAPERLRPVKIIRTMPYPGFPTDAQAPTMAMTTLAGGTSVFVENIFESRYKHTAELMRLGANIKVEGRVAVVEGVKRLSGAPVEASDLRGAAALVVAGLAAEGTTEIGGLRHLDRGYENIEQTLTGVGASVKRI